MDENEYNNALARVKSKDFDLAQRLKDSLFGVNDRIASLKKEKITIATSILDHIIDGAVNHEETSKEREVAMDKQIMDYLPSSCDLDDSVDSIDVNGLPQAKIHSAPDEELIFDFDNGIAEMRNDGKTPTSADLEAIKTSENRRHLDSINRAKTFLNQKKEIETHPMILDTKGCDKLGIEMDQICQVSKMDEELHIIKLGISELHSQI